MLSDIGRIAFLNVQMKFHPPPPPPQPHTTKLMATLHRCEQATTQKQLESRFCLLWLSVQLPWRLSIFLTPNTELRSIVSFVIHLERTRLRSGGDDRRMEVTLPFAVRMRARRGRCRAPDHDSRRWQTDAQRNSTWSSMFSRLVLAGLALTAVCLGAKLGKVAAHSRGDVAVADKGQMAGRTCFCDRGHYSNDGSGIAPVN